MNEEEKKPENKTGRPETKPEQFEQWLSDMRPFLENGHSLWAATDKAGLTKHRTTIYEKYREGGEFSQEIDRLQSLVGEYSNLIAVKTLRNVHTKIVETNGDYNMTREELQIWKTVAEKHRTAQPFFVNRTEEAQAKDEDFGRVVERPTIQINPPKEDDQDQPNTEDQTTGDKLQPDAETVEGVAEANGPSN